MQTKTRKPWRDMTYQELDRAALIEHALSLGDKSSEAIDYLDELSTNVPFTDEMKKNERSKMRGKYKRKKDKASGTFTYTNERLYTDEQIEKQLNERKETAGNGMFKLKQLYCMRYYPEIVPQKKQGHGDTMADMIAAARAEIKARGGKK